MYTFEQLKEDVRKEAKALKMNATNEELDRLNVLRLAPSHAERCIYGMMTGDCYSNRAAELISTCTPVFLDQIFAIADNGMEGIGCIGIADQDPFFKSNRTGHDGAKCRYSAIEAYILLPEANNANLIAYLKGESETLEL